MFLQQWLHHGSYSTSSAVSSEMGCAVLVCNQPLRPTRPPTLSRMGNGSGKAAIAVSRGWKGRYVTVGLAPVRALYRGEDDDVAFRGECR